MRLVRRAIRQDWPVSAKIQEDTIRTLSRYVDPDDDQCRTAQDRYVIAAAKTLIAAAGVNLKQQALDLAREKAEGKGSEVPLADLVKDAERRAEERRRERSGEG